VNLVEKNARSSSSGLWRTPAVPPLPVRPVPLHVVLLDPSVVRGDDPLPAFRAGEVVIGHPPLNIERSLDEILPRPPAFDLLLGYAQGAVDGLGLACAEDGAPVARQYLRRAVSLNGCVENGEVGGRVLAGGEGAREQRPRVVLEYGDRVDLVRSGRQLARR